MVLPRRKSESAKHRRITFLTSAGIGLLLLVGSVVVHLSGKSNVPGGFLELKRHSFHAPASGLARKLVAKEQVELTTTTTTFSDLYPNDLVLTKHCCDKDGKPTYGKDPNRWLIFLHCIGIGYMLLGLNTVCDVYFTGALEVMVDKWKIKPDVAGATFMAAGGSAPELFTSLVGALVAFSDVGFSTIVGSAVFNVLFVIGLCGYFAKTEIDLTWWPLFRDCAFYVVGLGTLAGFAKDNKVEFWEAAILFVMYLIYCCIMYINETLETKANELAAKFKKSKVSPEVSEQKDMTHANECKDPEATPEPCCDERVTGDSGLRDAADAEKGDNSNLGLVVATEPADKSDEDDGDSEDDHFIVKPEGAINQIIYYMSLPVYGPLYLFTPEPDSKLFLLTFTISLVWIAGFSFLLVWWVDILGQVIGISAIVMGFTLLAAGTSIPDLASSVAVAKQGEGDMAVSSSIGSNIFDILVGLPIPWMIKIATDGFTDTVKIGSPHISFYVALLLFMVICVILSIHFLGWKLNKTLGIFMAILYGIFLVCGIYTDTYKTEPWF
jgi:K+-dependent Na+/Ca+ exchanger-like protein